LIQIIGDAAMTETGYLREAEKFEIQAYKKPEDINTLRKTHVAFSGSPKRHPYDSDKVVLVADPYSKQNVYYEFSKMDISYVEELPSLVNLDGETVTMVRIWLKKMSIGLRCSPFMVEDMENTA
jgi:inorganic pyrophosphatase